MSLTSLCNLSGFAVAGIRGSYWRNLFPTLVGCFEQLSHRFLSESNVDV